jgi:integrase
MTALWKSCQPGITAAAPSKPASTRFAASSFFHARAHPRDLAGVGHASACHVLEQPLTRAGVEAVLAQLDGVPGLVCTLLYGSGLRLLEGLQLRVTDLDFGRGEITIREGKGQKDPLTDRKSTRLNSSH